ncbi:MAG: hypothetical protein JJU34_14565 [Lunatimonas sp.]|uniref:hypothetical protein n=1 Tax=Lunatimonas sp. TaxID=2060141 RepID=UPI00263AAAE2|nr:hypothetical protein [Lunatimonas sp.]MCC5938499.1 hypothetical protein [Lunatimonas sp.]
MKKVLAALFLLFVTTTLVFSQQAEKPVSVKLLIEGGFEFGGDEILQVFFTNGGDQTLRAGQGINLGIGGEMQFANFRHLIIRSAIGLKWTPTAADDANVMFLRFPVHLTPFWKINEDFRFGVGITTHLNPKLRGDGFFPDVAYTSSTNPRFEFGYKWFALTYTPMTYQNRQGESFSGNSIGISFSGTLPYNR